MCPAREDQQHSCLRSAYTKDKSAHAVVQGIAIMQRSRLLTYRRDRWPHWTARSHLLVFDLSASWHIGAMETCICGTAPRKPRPEWTNRLSMPRALDAASLRAQTAQKVRHGYGNTQGAKVARHLKAAADLQEEVQTDVASITSRVSTTSDRRLKSEVARPCYNEPSSSDAN
jgi:hypothetical protein